jgi:hypothetical protein
MRPIHCGEVSRGVVDMLSRLIRETFDPKRDPRVRFVPANITGGARSRCDEYGWWNTLFTQVPRNQEIVCLVRELRGLPLLVHPVPF